MNSTVKLLKDLGDLDLLNLSPGFLVVRKLSVSPVGCRNDWGRCASVFSVLSVTVPRFSLNARQKKAGRWVPAGRQTGLADRWALPPGTITLIPTKVKSREDNKVRDGVLGCGKLGPFRARG